VHPPAEAQWASVVITGVVRAGLVIVWTPVNVWPASVLARVEDVVGNVWVAVPPAANVVLNAPVVTKFPASVIVNPVLATPVPPYWPVITPPFHVPVMVDPRSASEPPPLGNVQVELDGIANVGLKAPVYVTLPLRV